jgi:hypothetical protein
MHQNQISRRKNEPEQKSNINCEYILRSSFLHVRKLQRLQGLCIVLIPDGVVSATQDLVGNFYNQPGWDLAISVFDGTTTVGPRSLSVLVHGNKLIQCI